MFSTQNAFGELIHLCISIRQCVDANTIPEHLRGLVMSNACFGSRVSCVSGCVVYVREEKEMDEHTICTHLDDYKIIKGNEAIECTQASLQPFKLQSSGELSLFSRPSLSRFYFPHYFFNDNKLWENLFINR